MGDRDQSGITPTLVSGIDAIGEIQTSPTSNSVLDRLKAILTGIVLATGSAIIGRVGHDITGIGHGRKVVTTAGTDVVLAASTVAKVVIIMAETDNTGIIVVGGSGVDWTLATRTGITLSPGESVTLEVDNLNDVYIDAAVSGDGVTYTYLT